MRSISRLLHPQSVSFRARVGAVGATVALLHVVGVVLLITGLNAGIGVILGFAVLAYGRGLLHAFDFDHISMIDNSLRKFVAEGRRPASVGLAFSAGHSMVVLVTCVMVIAGSTFVRSLVAEESGVTRTLGAIGLTASGLYLLLVAISNLGPFLHAWDLRSRLRRQPSFEVDAESLVIKGPAARLLAAPLRRVRHSGHVFGIGALFSLGFDTSSQIGLMIMAGSAILSGAPPVAMLALPILFAAGMTLADSVNSLMMLGLYTSAEKHAARRRLNLNITVTGLSIVSGLTVAILAATTLTESFVGGGIPVVSVVAGLDTSYAGAMLAALFFCIAIVAVAVRGRQQASAKVSVMQFQKP